MDYGDSLPDGVTTEGINGNVEQVLGQLRAATKDNILTPPISVYNLCHLLCLASSTGCVFITFAASFNDFLMQVQLFSD